MFPRMRILCDVLVAYNVSGRGNPWVTAVLRWGSLWLGNAHELPSAMALPRHVLLFFPWHKPWYVPRLRTILIWFVPWQLAPRQAPWQTPRRYTSENQETSMTSPTALSTPGSMAIFAPISTALSTAIFSARPTASPGKSWQCHLQQPPAIKCF